MKPHSVTYYDDKFIKDTVVNYEVSSGTTHEYKKGGKKSMAKLGERFTDQEEKDILDSIMPGGPKWKKWADKQEKQGKEFCRKSCPGYKKECKKRKKSIGLCSTEWGKEEDSLLHLKVLFHVLNNFNYYNRGDLPYKRNPKEISKLRKQIIKLRKNIYDVSLEIAKREIS